jgi:hypothetical protein
VTDGGAEVFLRTYNGKSLILPAGWHLTPPKPGEPVAAYRDRAILRAPGCPAVCHESSGDSLLGSAYYVPRQTDDGI